MGKIDNDGSKERDRKEKGKKERRKKIKKNREELKRSQKKDKQTSYIAQSCHVTVLQCI